jgi:V8-like Glu-specific endopeptidase
MSLNITLPEYHVAKRVLDTVSDIDALSRRIEADPDTFLKSTFRAAGVESGINIADTSAGSTPLIRSPMYDWGEAWVKNWLTGLQKLREGIEGASNLTHDETISLDTLVHLETRPAILVQDGGFSEPPDEWAVMEQYRASIESIFPAVGRIEAEGHPRQEAIGTGFLITDRHILTNKHVMSEFSCWKRKKWRLSPGMVARIDFHEEYERSEAQEHTITEVVKVYKKFDVAILALDASVAEEARKVPVLAIDPPELPQDRQRPVYVVGYPDASGAKKAPKELKRVFADVYDVKRLQPGFLTGIDTKNRILQHDCSTIGGNSGSCVIDLETNKVLGLHYAGKFGKANYAVAMWEFWNDPFLKKIGVTFA